MSLSRKSFSMLLCLVLLFTTIPTFTFAEGIVLAKGVSFSEGLLPFSRGGKYGYMDKSGNIAIPEQWEDAGSFSEGLAPVKAGEKWGYIDKNGTLVIDAQWDEANAFENGFACVANGAGMSLDDVSEDTWLVYISGGMTDDEFQAMLNGTKKYGVVDKNGTIITDLQWDDTISFSEERAVVLSDGKRGYIDTTGKLIVPCVWDRAGKYSEGLAFVTNETENGFLDKEGNMAIKSSWVSAGSFSDGLAFIKTEDIKGNDKYGFIDKTGNIVIQVKYDDAHSFSNGYAWVKIDDEEHLIDKTGTIVLSEKDLKKHGSVGTWGSEGYYFKFYGKVENGLFPVQMIHLRASDFKSTYTQGYIDLSGNIVIKANWDSIGDFCDGIAKVKDTDGKYGYISIDGRTIISAQYDDASDFSDGVAVVWKKDTWYIIDSQGNTIL